MVTFAKSFIPAYGAFTLIFSVFNVGCNRSTEAAREGTRPASECAQSELVRQCPPNTTPLLEADAEAICDEAASIDASSNTLEMKAGAEVKNACVGRGKCRVVCQLPEPCKFGIDSISPSMGIQCLPPPPGCGDGVCNEGETPETCAADCATDCTAGDTRCNAGALQTCTPRGQWDMGLECSAGEICVTHENGEATCKSDTCGDGEVDEREQCDDGNAINGDGCDNNCTRTGCGNGIRSPSTSDMPEECDDGNEDNDDNCTNECKLARCGDGVVGPGETCDLGPQNAESSSCTHLCQQARCGDGFVQSGIEACDDGNNLDDDTCTNACTLPTCGDGVVGPNEECDDSNRVDSDGCTNQCATARCGDGIQRTDIVDEDDPDYEACDDGQEGSARCSTMCTLGVCGNGIVEEGEECDDGDEINRNRCTNACRLPACGDGITRTDLELGDDGYEGCDDGNDNRFDACTNTCAIARCGDNLLRTDLNVGDDGYEACDDGANGVLGDGCDDQCQISLCGNGAIDEGEECDDGANNGSTKPCLSSCQRNVCGDGHVLEGDGGEGCDDGDDDDQNACTNACTEAECGDGITRTDLAFGEDGYESCDDGNDDDFSDGCNSACIPTETEPNDLTENANEMADRIVAGVMERRPDAQLEHNYDYYRFNLNCGVVRGEQCPIGREVKWLFKVRYFHSENLCRDSLSNVWIRESDGACCEGRNPRCNEPNPSDEQPFSVCVVKNGSCLRGIPPKRIPAISFCEHFEPRGEDPLECCTPRINAAGIMTPCALGAPEPLRWRELRFILDWNDAGVYEVGLRNMLSNRNIEYELIVEPYVEE